MSLLIAMATSALACGGFVCNSQTTGPQGDPVTEDVDQAGERILFKVDNDTVTVHVEVRYEGQPDEFAWLIPVPKGVEAGAVRTMTADFFNRLEATTAPTFTFLAPPQQFQDTGGRGFAGSGTSRRGCGCSGAMNANDATLDTAADWGGDDEDVYEVPPVEVIDEATVGPFAIEVLQVNDDVEFADWLEAEGYDLPDDLDPVRHYLTDEMQFLGVKLVPTLPEGPIDTLVFSYPGTEPSIPLVLTSIAATEDMPLVAYVLADELYAPANYRVAPFPWSEVQRRNLGTATNYGSLLTDVIDAYDGQAFVYEYGGPAADVFPQPVTPEEHQTWPHAEDRVLTRFRGEISPDEMTLDPYWVVAEDFEPQDNNITIQLASASSVNPGPRLGYALLLFAVPFLRRRR